MDAPAAPPLDAPGLASEGSTYSALLSEDVDGGAARPDVRWHTHLAFAALGVGPGWLLCDAVYLQVPWSQTTQPEGLALSSYIITSFNAANIVIVLLLLAHRVHARQGGDARALDEGVMVAMILATVLGLVGAALFWDVATETHSVALLGLSFLGGAIGALRLSVMMPWMLSYDDRLISSAVLGGALADGASAVIALVQQPGGMRLFSPTIFYLIAALLALPSLVAFALIKRFRLGLLPAPPARPPAEKGQAAGGRAVVEVDRQDAKLTVGSIRDRARAALSRAPWLGHATFLWLMFASMQSVVWGISPGLMPFAARNAVRGPGASNLLAEDVLSYAIDLSYIGLVAGSYASLICPSYRLVPQVAVLLAFGAVTVGMAYTPNPGLPASAGAAMLITSNVLMRFADGYATAMIFRCVAVDTRYDDAQNIVQRAISLAERVSTTIGAGIAWWLADGLMRTGGYTL
ncbi:hypothetical protein T492DRAFT_56903 [Pavlovales sp. CCMP2436]|nr:hypothetical protein T492DRAFT_56903 [Pavlovales sp. CCMP2436]|mmetsp:Transcript_6751/g.17651  ORF Transcript_6751/g.17651 Transcript_6751/m.17651 type:complete len:463 (+) Transcript_6751:87-1475(+)